MQYRGFRGSQGAIVAVLGCLLGVHQVVAQSAEDCETESTLQEGDYFCFDSNGETICGLNDESFFAPEDEFFAAFQSEPDESCSALNPSSEVLQNEFQRVYITDFLHRFSGVIQNRFFGGRSGGGDVVARGNNDMAGRAAGEGFAKWAPWLSYGRTYSENELASTAYDGYQDNFLLGADYSFSDRLIAGLSIGYENNDLNTTFNGGNYRNEGYTIAPYVAYLLADNISIDGTAGYSSLSIDQTRTNPVGGNTITAATDSDRWFIASNLNAFHRYGNLSLLGRFGIIYSEDDQDGFTEAGAGRQTVASSKSEFGQIQIGGEVAYSAHALEPFASVYYEYDYESETPQVGTGQAAPSGDDDDFRLAAGFRYFGDNGFTGTLEYSGIVGREDYDSHSISLIGRLQF